MSTQTLIREAQQFTDTRHRWPSRSPFITDPTERDLATRVDHLRTRHLSARARASIVQAIPGWDDPSEAGWHADAEDIGTHMWVHGRFPSQASYDPDEARLAHWQTTQKGARHGRSWAPSMTREHELFIDASAPGWDRVRDFEAEFRSNVQEVVAWVRAHGNLPRQTGNLEEARLARRISRWRSAARGKDGRHDTKFGPDRSAYLDTHLPGWAGKPRTPAHPTRNTLRDTQWYNTGQDVVRFVRRNRGLFPNRTSFDRAERRLGWWVYEQRNAADRGTAASTPQRRTWLDTHLPGWDQYMRQGSKTRPPVKPKTRPRRATGAAA